MSDRQFNGLTSAQQEVLAVLAEEMGEAIQIIGKTLRHGIDSYHPSTRITNRELMKKELGDVCAAMKLVEQEGLADMEEVLESAEDKLDRIGKFLHHATVKP